MSFHLFLMAIGSISMKIWSLVILRDLVLLYFGGNERGAGNSKALGSRGQVHLGSFMYTKADTSFTELADRTVTYLLV